MICTTTNIIKHCQIHVHLFRIKLNELLPPLNGHFSLKVLFHLHVFPMSLACSIKPGLRVKRDFLYVCEGNQHSHLVIVTWPYAAAWNCDSEFWSTHTKHMHTLLKFRPATKRTVYAFIYRHGLHFPWMFVRLQWGRLHWQKATVPSNATECVCCVCFVMWETSQWYIIGLRCVMRWKMLYNNNGSWLTLFHLSLIRENYVLWMLFFWNSIMDLDLLFSAYEVGLHAQLLTS